MSFESALHVALVRQLCQTIKADHSELYSLLLFADLPEFGRNKPPRVAGYVPDVLALDAPETVRIIGEAKTPADFETSRSQGQIGAFLRHLALFPSAQFYLALPWPYIARGRTLLFDLRTSVGAEAVQVAVVGG